MRGGSRIPSVEPDSACFDSDANLVQLNHLLDLKQKQSNLDEARSSRRLADAADQRALEAARQGMLLTVFTLVTVIFVSSHYGETMGAADRPPRHLCRLWSHCSLSVFANFPKMIEV